jgi:uncharacterized protein (DUF362 family)/NAD-dependent dihydropyrimidine dehydrogenase PreA subunit
MNNKVSLIKCDSYDTALVVDSVRKSLEPFGGMKNLVKEGDKVLLKVNMLWAAKPEASITTHPAVVEAVIKLLQELNCKVIIADSPAGMPHTSVSLKHTHKVCGYEELAEKYGVECITDPSVESVSMPDSYLIKRADIIKAAVEADSIINLPKAKTHSYTYLTAATKNMFGIIPGFEKAGYHSKLKEPANFAKMLLDIVNKFKPAVSIMDAIMGMEGNGPSAGDPRKIGAIITSTDTIALDVVIATIMGMKPTDVPTIKAAVDLGLNSGTIKGVEIIGEPLDSMIVKNFKLPLTLAQGTGFSSILSPFQSLFKGAFLNAFTVKPVINTEKCIGCGICEKACPEKAIILENKKAQIKDNMCIRCYCCHEMCPYHVVELKGSFLNRIVRLISH